MGVNEKVIKTTTDFIRISTNVASEILKVLLDELIKLNNNNDKVAKELLKYKNKGGNLDFVEVNEKIYNKYIKEELEKEKIISMKFSLYNNSTETMIQGILLKDKDKEKFMEIRNNYLIKEGLLSKVTKNEILKACEEKNIEVIHNVSDDVLKGIIRFTEKNNLCIAYEKDEKGLYNIYSIPEKKDLMAMALVFSSFDNKFEYSKKQNEFMEIDSATKNTILNKIEDHKNEFIIGCLSDYDNEIEIKEKTFTCRNIDENNEYIKKTYARDDEDLILRMKIAEMKAPIIINRELLKDKESKEERLKILKTIVMGKRKEQNRDIDIKLKKIEELNNSVYKEIMDRYNKEHELVEKKLLLLENYDTRENDISLYNTAISFSEQIEHELVNKEHIEEEEVILNIAEIKNELVTYNIELCPVDKNVSIDEKINNYKQEMCSEKILDEMLKNNKNKLEKDR